MIDSDLEELVRTFIEVCRRVEAKGFVAAYDGNISLRLPNSNILTTPTGINKSLVQPQDLVEITLDGVQVGGTREPSSEMGMHLFIYHRRPDIRAVVHCHPVHATAFAAARIPLTGNVFPEVIVGLGSVPLAPYATPSTHEVSDSMAPFVQHADAILLSNHGVVTYGKDLWDAYFKMEKVEHAAHIESVARSLGGLTVLTNEDLAKLARLATGYKGKDFSETTAGSSQTGDVHLTVTQDEMVAIVDEVKKRLRQLSS